MRRFIILIVFLLAMILSFSFSKSLIFAATPVATSSASPQATLEPTPEASPRPDLTQKSQSTVGPLEKLLNEQKLGPVWPTNPLKYAIRLSVDRGVPANTIVLLLLLPVIAAFIASARHLIGLRGFGIFLPAALSVVFVATGPLLGVVLFLAIVAISIFLRFSIRSLKIKLQYLPRMAFLLWAVSFGVLGILFLSPYLGSSNLMQVSIFPVLILALLAEDFSRVQLGKSFKVALSLTTETLILSFVSYLFLTFTPLQEFALLNPEVLLLSVAIFDLILGRYVGLRLMEIWRFRKLIRG